MWHRCSDVSVPDVCPDELPCENGGYTDPKDCSVCRCPDGYAGVLCNQLSPDSQGIITTSDGFPSRRGTCLALRFQTGSWMLFIDSRNSNKMAVVYTVHTSSIRIFNCLYFPDATSKTFSVSQIDCTPLDSQMRVCRHHTGASPVFSIGSLSTGGGTVWQCWLVP